MTDREKLEQVEKLARELIARWDETATWEFRFDRARTRLGVCRFYPDGRIVISLSRHFVLLNPIEEAEDTILHEIAHALAGPKANHGPQWKAIARQVGATPKACADLTVEEPHRPWIEVCSDCGKTFRKYYRRPKHVKYHIPCRVGDVGGEVVFRANEKK